MQNILYFIELNKDKDFSDYNKLINLLSLEKQAQIHKFKFDIDKKLSLLSDLLVRYLACVTLKVRNEDLVFTKNAFGKPFLKEYPGFQYNVSHTRAAIVVGVSKKSIGVDIERVDTHELKIAERFFHKNEFDYILSKKIERNKYFYEVWTKKEAYIKWVGKGLSIPLSSFDITDFELDQNLNTFEKNEYILSVCCEDRFTNSNIVDLTELDLELLLLKFESS